MISLKDRPFHYCQQRLSISLKWCSLQKGLSKFTLIFFKASSGNAVVEQSAHEAKFKSSNLATSVNGSKLAKERSSLKLP
jgi:hypothetical protein